MSNWEYYLDESIDRVQSDLVELRRHLHRFPELSGHEYDTTRYLQDWFDRRSLPTTSLSSGRGLYVDLDSETTVSDENNGGTVSGERKRIGLRADIDALPIQDVKVTEYCSQVASVMHACGHDAHTAIVTGAILGLQSLMGEGLAPQGFALRGLFQPAEETCAGANEMIQAGTVDTLSGIFAVHVDPKRDVGTIGWRVGALTANCDELMIRVHGRGGHGARPHETDNPISAAALLVTNLQAQVSQSTDSQEPVVISIGRISGGSNSNVIPSEVQLHGTLRTLSSKARDISLAKVRQIVNGVGQMTGTNIDLQFGISGPSVVNDPELTGILREAGMRLLGAERVLKIDRPSMGSEDFAFYAERTAIAMIRLGCRSNERGHHPLHTPAFDIDERTLIVGAKLLARAAILWFQSKSTPSTGLGQLA